MSDSNNHRNPFADDEVNQTTIERLVAGAVQTHRDPEAATRRRPRYPTEDRRSKMTLNLDPETIAILRAITHDLGAGKRVSSIAQALLDYALDAYRTKQITLELRPAPIGFRFEAVEKNQ
jgi:hypothetical protein